MALLFCSALLFSSALAADMDEAAYEGILFVRIPAGALTMGTSDHDRALLKDEGFWTRFEECERPARLVTLSEPFFISKCEITQKQWKAVMDKNPSAFQGEDLPVESVSWTAVQAFLKKLNERGAGRYRLPTEAEWEYCCRAGSTNLYGLGRDETPITTGNLSEYAWYRANAESQTHPVGTKAPNAWGLHDMHGNVWEWCQDWYAADYYARAPAAGPLNRETSTERVFRGGSWFLEAYPLRAAFRSGNLPRFKSPYVGFRLVREVD